MIYHHTRFWKWLAPASIHSCARLVMLRYTRCNIVILMAATSTRLQPSKSKSKSSKFLCGYLKSTVHESNPHTIQGLRDNISYAVAAIKITMLYRVYINMVTARLLTSCSNTLRNIHTNARDNITRTRAKWKVGYFFVSHVCHSRLELRHKKIRATSTQISSTINGQFPPPLHPGKYITNWTPRRRRTLES